MANVSIVEYIGKRTKYQCGYCKKEDTSYSHGMWAHVMTPEDYQSLMDRGWQRAGKYVYKVTSNLTCCPTYIIRCDALEIKLTKSQKNVLKRFRRYLSGETLPSIKNEDKVTNTILQDRVNLSAVAPSKGLKASFNFRDIMFRSSKNAVNNPVTSESISSDLAKSLNVEKSTRLEGSVLGSKLRKPADMREMNPNPPKAREIRIERKKNKFLEKGLDPSNIQWKKRNGTRPKSLEDLMMVTDSAHKKFSIRTVKVDSPEFKDTFDLEHELYRSYLTCVHNFKESECTQEQFKEFLCDNPYPDTDDIYGAYHQQYYLDDTLIAVGVVEILPTCLSSVYFFYSPSHMNLSLGTFGALLEIAYLRELNRSRPNIRYYYLGWYIHSCGKMRYKGSFSPSYLLCPELYTWHFLDDTIRAELSAKKYQRLNKSTEVMPAVENPLNAGILFKNTAMTNLSYSCINGRGDKEEIQEYVNLVGESCAESMLLYRAGK